MDGVMIFNLKNSIIFLTGPNGHLGTAMAEILAENQATLILASRNYEKNVALAQRLTQAYGNINFPCICDVENETSVIDAVDSVISQFGKIDVLINNAAYSKGTLLHQMSQEEWQKGIDGSVTTVFRCIKAIIPNMILNKLGKIINVSSMYGIVAPDVSIYKNNSFYNPVNYGVGKAGVIQLTKYVASVYGQSGITCNCISPGPFPNQVVQKDKEFIDILSKKNPLGRIGTPEDIKGVVLLLASQASNFINGANIVVDGGWTIW